jgi:hypothetical protein
MEIDHIDPATKDPLLKRGTSLFSWSQERRDVELAKCQVLCGKCHMQKTLNMRRKTDHGRGQMYHKYGCRCDRCKAWKLTESRRYNSIRKTRRGAGAA